MTIGMTLAEALSHGQGDERPIRCPSHDDTNASASVNVVKGVWCCYACGASGRVDGYSKPPDYAEIVAAMSGRRPVTLPESWLDVFDGARRCPSVYWGRRYGGVAARFRCGTHPVTGNPTYPVRSPVGGVLGVVQRTDGTPKYLYPPGVSVSTTLFNYPPLSRRIDVVVLVEGASDVMALHRAPPRWAVLGCYGSGLHHRQTELVKALGAKTIICAFDSDDAGRRATASAEQIFNDHPDVVSVDWSSLTAGKASDPGEAYEAGADPYRLLYGIRSTWR